MISKLGTVRPQYILEQTPEYQKEIKKLNDHFGHKEGEFVKKGEELRKMQETIQENSGIWSEERMRQEQEKYSQQSLMLKEDADAQQIVYQKKGEEITRPFLDNIQIYIETVAKEGLFTHVVNLDSYSAKDLFLYLDPEFDISDKVLVRMILN